VLCTAGPARAQHNHDHGHDPGDAHDHGTDKHNGHTDEVHLTAEAIERYGIKLDAVKQHTLLPTFTAPARVSFNTEAMAHVGSVLRGRIVELKAKVGDQVGKGDELMVVESPELAEAQSDFLLKSTEAEVAEITVEPLNQAYERARSLHERNEGIALAEVQKREVEWRAAEGRLASAKAAATAAENKMHALGMDQAAVEKLLRSREVSPRAGIHAPITGQVIQREVTLGELVNAERDALMVLADMRTLWVIAEVPETRLPDVSIGSTARIELATAGHDPLEGKVTHISASLNAETRTASVLIEVPGSGELRPGMFARVQITVGSSESTKPVLAIPESAVMSVEGGPCVFVPVEGEANTYKKQEVKVGKAVGGMLPIVDGLKEGQQVVVKGAFILKADLGKSGAEHQH
jgi:cobalt-zinc-cadmium efflux system membrane fusion protein